MLQLNNRQEVETAEQGVRVPAVLFGAINLAGVITLVLWQRKRQFDRKGFHKKI